MKTTFHKRHGQNIRRGFTLIDPSTGLRMTKGFTLIELLIGIGIIGVLASVVMVAINPTKQLCDAENAKRQSHVNALTKAMMQYVISEWEMPAATDTPTGEGNAKPICAAGITENTNCVNLDVLVPDYLVSLPIDDAETDANFTGYGVYKTAASRQFAVALHFDHTCGATASEESDASSSESSDFSTQSSTASVTSSSVTSSLASSIASSQDSIGTSSSSAEASASSSVASSTSESFEETSSSSPYESTPSSSTESVSSSPYESTPSSSADAESSSPYESTPSSSSADSCPTLLDCQVATHGMCQSQCESYGYNNSEECSGLTSMYCSPGGNGCYVIPSSCPIPAAP